MIVDNCGRAVMQHTDCEGLLPILFPSIKGRGGVLISIDFKSKGKKNKRLGLSRGGVLKKIKR